MPTLIGCFVVKERFAENLCLSSEERDYVLVFEACQITCPRRLDVAGTGSHQYEIASVTTSPIDSLYGYTNGPLERRHLHQCNAL
jgi:hypothetical protein